MVMYCGVKNMEKCRGVEPERHILVAMNDSLGRRGNHLRETTVFPAIIFFQSDMSIGIPLAHIKPMFKNQ